MATNLTRAQLKSTLIKAKNYLSSHGTLIKGVTQGVEGFAAPLLLGIGEGYFAKDGTARVEIMGVPLTLGLGVIGLAAGATGYAGHYNDHAINMATGLLGSYGIDVGRKLGLTMRVKAGKGGVAPGALPAQQMKEIAAKCGGEFSGEFNTLEYGVGATPKPLTATQLEEMMREAMATT